MRVEPAAFLISNVLALANSFELTVFAARATEILIPAVPSKLAVPVASPAIAIALAVSHAVAVAALPVQDPDEPVTLPVMLAIKPPVETVRLPV